MTATISYLESVPRAEELWALGDTPGFHDGYDAWRSLWAGLNSKNPLSDDQQVELRKRAVHALRHLDADGYVAFCQRVQGYVEDHPASDVFSDIPRFKTAQECYPAELDSLEKKVALLDKYKTPAIFITGALGFFGGAIGIGTLADSGIDNTYLNHVITAAGSLVSGIVGSGLTGLGFLFTGDYLDTQKQKIGEKTKEDLIAKVQLYLAHHL